MNSAVVVQAEESEQQLINRAQHAVSDSAWIVGECASLWCERYARGRTDEAFAAIIGMSREQVLQRRRVFESFDDIRNTYSTLRWSHFYVAIAWDDAAECLQWADENAATVAEMKAYREKKNSEPTLAGSPSEEDEPEEEPQEEPYEEDTEEPYTEEEEEDEPEESDQEVSQEPYAEIDATENQRKKTIKTIAALIRAFDDLQDMLPDENHSETIKACKELLEIVRVWG